MPKFFDKMRDFVFGADEDYDYDYDDYDNDAEEEYEIDYPSQRERSYQNTYRSEYNRDYSVAPRNNYSSSNSRRNSQVVSIHTNVQMMVVIIKPECYEDAQEICDQIKEKRPVVVNLEKVEYPIAQRIMDFLSGTCYSLDGSIQRVASNIFIIAPANVDITGDFKEELKTKGIILPWVNSGK